VAKELGTGQNGPIPQDAVQRRPVTTNNGNQIGVDVSNTMYSSSAPSATV